MAAAENAVRTDASGAVAVVSVEVGRAVADDGTANRRLLARGSAGQAEWQRTAENFGWAPTLTRSRHGVE